jgi:hypothetical protein
MELGEALGALFGLVTQGKKLGDALGLALGRAQGGGIRDEAKHQAEDLAGYSCRTWRSFRR